MPTNNKSIQILRGTTTIDGESNVDKTILETGQPFYDKRTNTLRIGHDNKTINSIAPITVDDGAINDAKVASDAAIKGSKLADANGDTSSPTGITTAKIENGAITTEKIGDSAVTPGKLNRTYTYVMHQLLCEDNDANRDARYTASSLQFVDHNKKYKPGTGSKFVSSQLSLVPNETVTGGFTLKLPWVSGTLATKEQLPTFQSSNGNLYITTND